MILLLETSTSVICSAALNAVTGICEIAFACNMSEVWEACRFGMDVSGVEEERYDVVSISFGVVVY